MFISALNAPELEHELRDRDEAVTNEEDDQEETPGVTEGDEESCKIHTVFQTVLLLESVDEEENEHQNEDQNQANPVKYQISDY